jgi:hypothetical protein
MRGVKKPCGHGFGSVFWAVSMAGHGELPHKLEIFFNLDHHLFSARQYREHALRDNEKITGKVLKSIGFEDPWPSMAALAFD